MDTDVALTQPIKQKENTEEVVSPAEEAYGKLTAETLLNNRTRILAFKRKPPVSTESMLTAISESDSTYQYKITKSKEHILLLAKQSFFSSYLLDDFYLNPLDWGSRNVLSIAFGYIVLLWNASEGSTSNFSTHGRVTSVSWAPDGQHLAIGLNDSKVQLWDSSSARLLRTLKEIHGSRVGTLAWNNNILATGGMDGKIVINDVRIQNHAVNTYRGHQQEVCGLKWSASGKHLASGGNDNLIHIWDYSISSSTVAANQSQWLHRFEGHNAAVKALAWCPFRSNLLASGGGSKDRCIKFWNTLTGDCLNSIDSGSQVCALLWNKNERELLSSHGFTQNQLTLWKYPSMMVKAAELCGRNSSSRVLYMAQSPDGCTVATAGGDATVRIWNVWGCRSE